MPASGPDGLDWLVNWGTIAQFGQGLGLTCLIALVSAGLSMVLGTGFGFLLAAKSIVVRGLARVYLEAVRIVPLVVMLYLGYYVAAADFGLNITNVACSIVVFTVWGTGEFGDIVRGAITTISRHQYESGRALGLTTVQLYVRVIVPQSVRRVAPAAINLITRMVKTTSLCSFITVAEVMTVGRQVISVANQSFRHPEAPFAVYTLVMALYFLICWPISIGAKKLERVWAS